MICSECNAKNAKSDKFCRNCGKKLVEDANETKTSNNLESFIKKAWNDVKGMFIKPLDSVRKFVKDDNYLTSLIYLGVNVLGIALFVLLLVKSLYGTMTSYLGLNSLDSIGHLGYGSFDSLYETIEIPYFKIFLLSVITVVIVYALLAGVSYLVCNYLFKSKTSFKKMLAWVGINSVFNTVACLTVLLGMLISFKLGIVLYLIGSVLYAYNLFNTLEFATDTDKNKLGYVLTISIMAIMLVVCIIFPKIFF